MQVRGSSHPGTPNLPLSPQPAVELPPFHASDLCVEGVSVRKARKQMPPISSFSCSSSLSDSQPLAVRCPSATPDLAPGRPPTAPQQDLKLRNEKVLPCTLPAPLKRPAQRSHTVQSVHAESGGRVEFPSCHFQHADSKALKTGLSKAESSPPSDSDSLDVHPLLPVLPSVKTVEGTVAQPPRPPGNSTCPSVCLPGAACSTSSGPLVRAESERQPEPGQGWGHPVSVLGRPGCQDSGGPGAAVPGTG